MCIAKQKTLPSSPFCLKKEEEWHNFTHFTTLPPSVPFCPCEKQLLFFFPFATRAVWLRGAFFLSLLALLWERGAVKRTASSFLRPTLSVSPSSSELMRWSVGFWGKDFPLLPSRHIPKNLRNVSLGWRCESFLPAERRSKSGESCWGEGY